MFKCFFQDAEFSGLIPLINKFLDSVDVDFETRCTISQYLKFISKKASGKRLGFYLLTGYFCELRNNNNHVLISNFTAVVKQCKNHTKTMLFRLKINSIIVLRL